MTVLSPCGLVITLRCMRGGRIIHVYYTYTLSTFRPLRNRIPVHSWQSYACIVIPYHLFYFSLSAVSGPVFFAFTITDEPRSISYIDRMIMG